MKEKIKKYWWWAVLIICACFFAWQESDLFWIALLVLVAIIYFIVKKQIIKKIIRIMSITIWSSCVVVAGLIFYVNYYLPHGPSYSTEYYTCDDYDRCKEAYVEDMSNLNIPRWAKFLRSSNGMLLWLSLCLMGVVISSKKDKGNDENVV